MKKRPEQKAAAILNFYCNGERVHVTLNYVPDNIDFWLRVAKSKVGETKKIYGQNYLIERVNRAPKLSKKINIHLKKVE